MREKCIHWICKQCGETTRIRCKHKKLKWERSSSAISLESEIYAYLVRLRCGHFAHINFDLKYEYPLIYLVGRPYKIASQGKTFVGAYDYYVPIPQPEEMVNNFNNDVAN